MNTPFFPTHRPHNPLRFSGNGSSGNHRRLEQTPSFHLPSLEDLQWSDPGSDAWLQGVEIHPSTDSPQPNPLNWLLQADGDTDANGWGERQILPSTLSRQSSLDALLDILLGNDQPLEPLSTQDEPPSPAHADSRQILETENGRAVEASKASESHPQPAKTRAPQQRHQAAQDQPIDWTDQPSLFRQARDFNLLEIEPISNRTRQSQKATTETPEALKAKPVIQKSKSSKPVASSTKPKLTIKLDGQILKPSQPEPAEAPINSTPAASRWRALLLATTWARKLVQLNKQKTAERQAELASKTQNAATAKTLPAVADLKAAEPRKRSHAESETQTQETPKKRRLYRANGEPVRPAIDHQEPTPQPAQPISSIQRRHHRSKFFIPLDTQAKAKAPRSQGRFATQFDDTIREKVLALKRQNKSAAEIERRTGVAQRTMYSWFKAANLTQANTVNFTPKDAKIREQALRMKQEKLHTERISEKLDVPANTLRKWFQAAGLNQAREAYSKEVKAQALSQYNAGMAPAQVSAKLNVPIGRIYAWVNEAGVANRKKPHSEETRQTVFKLYEQNRSFAEIVKKTGVSEATVTKWLSESGMANRRKTHDPQLREEVIARYKQNPDRHQISKELKISVNTVKKWITKTGLTQRRQSD